MRRNKLTVRLLRPAEDDLTDIITYVAADRPAAATALLEKFESRLNLLSTRPQLGAIPKEPELSRLHYRCLVVENYLIFYTVEGSTVYVHRILHGARDFLRVF